MAIQATEKIWHNGKLIPWKDAQIHVMAHVINYGSSVFEGIRCYAPARQAGHLPASRPHAEAHRFGQDLPHRY